MGTVKKQTVEEAWDIVRGFEDGTVSGTKPLYLNGNAKRLAAKIRGFIAAHEGGTIVGFESDNNLGNTFVHSLPHNQQIQMKTFQKIANGLNMSCTELFDSLVNEPDKKQAEEVKQPTELSVDLDLSQLAAPSKLVIEDIPFVGTLVADLRSETFEVYDERGRRRKLKS